MVLKSGGDCMEALLALSGASIQVVLPICTCQDWHDPVLFLSSSDTKKITVGMYVASPPSEGISMQGD